MPLLESEAKEGDGEVVEETWGDAELGRVLKEAADMWLENEGYREALTTWVDSHSEEFEDHVGDLPDLSDCEHKLHYGDLHKQYLELFETQISNFVNREEYSTTAFFEECKAALDGFGVALFDEHEEKWFVEALLSAMDYASWFEMMVNKAAENSKSSRK